MPADWSRDREGVATQQLKPFGGGFAGEPVIRKDKAKMVKVQEAENQAVTLFEVYEQRPVDSDLPIPSPP